jgi:uncharacterized RDD family membrane protein YckC
MEYEDRVRIATPEGVDVELTLAGIGSRFIAAFFDFAIQWSVIIASGVLLGVIGGGGRDWVFLLGAVGAAGGGWENAVFAIIFFVVFFGYDVLFEVRARGRTPGKRWTGLRVVRTGGQPVTLVPSCVRNVMRVVDFLPVMYGIGMTSIFVTSRNQRLGDLAGGTLVMRERPASLKSSATNGAQAAFPAADAWDVSAVSAQDIGTVRQFLARRETLAEKPRAELAGELERRLRPRVAGAPEGLAAEEFLERLAAAKL